MSAESFFDTNVFIYHLDTSDLRKHDIAGRIIRDAVSSGNGCISYQVVQECMNTVLRKAELRLDAEGARSYLDTVLAPLFHIPASIALYHRALDIHTRYQFGFYDALIVAAALGAGCTRLYSEDLQHGQRIEGLTVEDPFRS